MSSPSSFLERRPEAMADVPGVCDLPLTRAIVQYRDAHELDALGGRIQDIGLAVVLDGQRAAQSDVIDLGSGAVKTLDLSGEMVVVDWLYAPALEHLRSQVREAALGRRGPLQRLCEGTATRILDRTGFGPVTRPILLRIAFRDICRDLDLNEGTSIRIVVGPSRLVRARFDYDRNALVLSTPTSQPDAEFETVVERAFGEGTLYRMRPVSVAASGGVEVRFTLPGSLPELHRQMTHVREGLLELCRVFEPERYRETVRLTQTFGRRDTLARLRSLEASMAELRQAPSAAATTVRSGSDRTVH